MAKTVFKPTEVQKKEDPVVLELSKKFHVELAVEEIEEEPLFEGPTADDLRREAEVFLKEWEVEKAALIESAHKEAETILQEAQHAAFEEVKRKTDQGQEIKQTAQDEANQIIANAEKQAQELISETTKKMQDEQKTSYDDGFKKGQEDGFKEGSLEANRLIDRLHTIIERTMDKRHEILAETEQQIVELVLLMTRKIVKVISENQKNIVISNVIQALRKVKGRGDVTIRVNLADLGLTSQHTKEFLEAAENVKHISVVEDTTVDRGGCIIETDFGSIDARIMSQLNEIEQKILEVSPIRSRVKSSVVSQE